MDALGGLLPLQTAFSAWSSFLCGSLLRRWSTATLVVASCLLTSSGLLIFSVAPPYAVLVLAMIPLGFGAGAVDASLNDYVARHYTSRHMNWLHACWGAGATLGPVIMTAAIASRFGWTMGYRVLGLIQLGMAALLFVSIPLWKRPAGSASHTGSAHPTHHGTDDASSRAGWMSIGLYLLYSSMEATTALWANSLMVEARGLPAARAGLFASAFFAAIPVNLRHQGCEAYYEPSADRVTMPPASLFNGFDHYYATLAHELSHWTGHATRLGRDLKNRFGTAAYAAEELVAELSSAMLGAELGLPVTHLDSHASYIEHWLKLLKDDDRAILTAAAKAEEASSLLLKLGGRVTPEQSDDASGDAALAA